jgi:O-antigen ligase
MRRLVVIIGFSIPVSTSLSEIATTLFIVCWLLAGNWAERWRLISRNPIALLSLAMFAFLLLGMTWSSATWRGSGRCLLKYREFVYLPMLMTVLQDSHLKMRAMQGFVAGAAGMLAASYFEWLSGVDVGLPSSTNDYVIAKDRIIHSLLLAILVYFSAQELRRGRGRWRLHIGVIALSAPNILFLVQGRTGYLLLGALTILFMTQHFGRRGLAFACLLVAATGCGAYAVSETVQGRVAQTIAQIKNQFGHPKLHSWDPRLEYYEHTFTLIGRHPLRGTGTGSFNREYSRSAKSSGVEATSDPHNEYLHLAVQLGLPGTALFIALLVWQWRLAAQLPVWESQIGRGIVLAIAVGSLFNSLILSITGGLVWSYFSAIAFAGLSSEMQSAAAESSARPTLRQAA